MKLENLKKYAFLLRRFRNAPALIDSIRRGRRCSVAISWDGRRLEHPPGRDGLAGTLVEVWGEDCYAQPGFTDLRPGETVVDAGAHIGLFSLSVLKRQPEARVFAFEPSAENASCLRKNLAEYGAAGSVTVVEEAVSGWTGAGVLRAMTERSIDHRLFPATEGEPGAIGTRSLDDLVDMAGGEISLLKMDVEGSEHAAFEAASEETIKALRRLVLEYHDNLVPGTLELLKARLSPTHDLRVIPTGERGYGVMFATRRAA
jgi:FkbM family methyltransferase